MDPRDESIRCVDTSGFSLLSRMNRCSLACAFVGVLAFAFSIPQAVTASAAPKVHLRTAAGKQPDIGQELVFDVAGRDCRKQSVLAKDQPATLFLSAGIHNWRVHTGGICTLADVFSNVSEWQASTIGEYQEAPGEGFVFAPFLDGPKNELFSWRFVLGNVQIGQGHFIVQRSTEGGLRKIWATTDDYWNICVNKGHQVRMQGGMAYCYSGTVTNMTRIKVLHQ